MKRWELGPVRGPGLFKVLLVDGSECVCWAPLQIQPKRYFDLDGDELTDLMRIEAHKKITSEDFAAAPSLESDFRLVRNSVCSGGKDVALALDRIMEKARSAQ